MQNNVKYGMDLPACERLAEAIILQAVEDYRKALRRRSRTQDKMLVFGRLMECERFFRSQWFGVLTDVNGKTLMQSLKDEHERERGRREALFAPIR